MRIPVLVLVSVVTLVQSLGEVPAQSPSDSGTVLVSLIERPIGKETYATCGQTRTA